MIKNILVPTDFSTEATYALDFAADLCRRTNAVLHLIHVVEVPSGSYSTDGQVGTLGGNSFFTIQLLKRIKSQMNQLKRNKKYEGITIKDDIKIDTAFHSIAENIDSENIDLVVMGTKGVSGMDELLVGSNTEKVVRYSKCPVLAIKQEMTGKDIKSICFANDFVNGNKFAIEHIKEMQRLFDAKIHLLWVNTPRDFYNSREINDKMKSFAKMHDLQNFELHTYIDNTAEDGILNFADEFNMDVIAVATHQRKGFMHFFTGSVSEDVVNHATKMVLTIRLEK